MKGENQIPPGGSLPALLCLWPCQPHLCAWPHGGELIFYCKNVVNLRNVNKHMNKQYGFGDEVVK